MKLMNFSLDPNHTELNMDSPHSTVQELLQYFNVF